MARIYQYRFKMNAKVVFKTVFSLMIFFFFYEIESMIPILVVFHMIGCPHCQKVSGEKSILRNMKRVILLEIESAHPFCRKLGVASFPTIWLTNPNKIWNFSGKREKNDVQEWIDEKIRKIRLAKLALKSLQYSV